jgi:hypothetical protein
MTNCSLLKKDACNASGCVWVVGKGCRSGKDKDAVISKAKAVTKKSTKTTTKTTKTTKPTTKAAKTTKTAKPTTKASKAAAASGSKKVAPAKKTKSVPKVMPSATGPLVGFNVVFTGFRNNELKYMIMSKGGMVSSAASGKTTHVLIKNLAAKESRSIQVAKSFGIPIMTVDEFLATYMPTMNAGPSRSRSPVNVIPSPFNAPLNISNIFPITNQKGNVSYPLGSISSVTYKAKPLNKLLSILLAMGKNVIKKKGYKVYDQGAYLGYIHSTEALVTLHKIEGEEKGKYSVVAMESFYNPKTIPGNHLRIGDIHLILQEADKAVQLEDDIVMDVIRQAYPNDISHIYTSNKRIFAAVDKAGRIKSR